MSDEEQRIAIAEACGWEMASGTMRGQPVGIHPDEIDSATAFDYRLIPDYANDLNAMHEAEASLSFADQRKYGRALKSVLDASPDSPDHDWHATARQRAEAFIRTFGTWKEEA